MESRIARLDEVEEPRKEWVLQFTIAPRPALELGRRHPRRGHRAPRRLHARPGVAPGQRRRPDRRSPAPTAPARRPCCGCCSATLAPDEGRASLGATVAVGEIDQARTGAGRGPAARRRLRGRRARDDRRPTCARCWRSSASRPTRSPARSAGSRPASAPAPRWRCCRPAGSTCSCSTSRPTTSTCRRSSSSSRRWSPTTATLLLVSHDRRLLDNVRLDQRWQVDGGQVVVR